jgi:SAM-dependent methyltransferase
MKWDNEKISRFWDFFSSHEVYQDLYFTKLVGKNIVHFLKYVTPLEGRILDYGCGMGYLSEQLLDVGIPVEGLDVSRNSVDAVNEKFKHNPQWGGTKLLEGDQLPYPDDTFDLIICVEVLEHLPREKLHFLLSEFNRIMKPLTGKLFITTPFNENILMRSSYCPECNHIFHPVQHLNSFNIGSMSNLLESEKFSTELCNTVNFATFDQDIDPKNVSWKEWHYTYIKNKIVDRLRNSYGWIWPNKDYPKKPHQFRRSLGKDAHLFWIGKKI